MRQSQLFSKTRKEGPKDEVSSNATLLIRAGYIHKEMAGVYSFLPLGLRVLEKVNAIIRDEMNAAGGRELFLTSLQGKEPWVSSGRWDDKAVDSWFKTSLKNGTELGLAFTHEEPLTALMRDHIRSFRDLPVYVYQIQTKFRNESRAKSGILRTREFLMKDLYSFSKDENEHGTFYEKMKETYKNVFNRAGIGDRTYLTYASGGSFSKFSHEFQTVCDAGEDTIHICEKCNVAVNEEIIKEQPTCPSCGGKKFVSKKAVEVGNIFTLGTRFSEALGLKYIDEKNESKSVFMGSYGIGPARLIGAVVEATADKKGLVWPETLAPFAAHIIALEGEEAARAASDLYEKLKKSGVEVLLDDRAARAGEKFADADLIGIPKRVVVSAKTVSAGKLEVEDRKSGKKEMLAADVLLKNLSK